MTPISQGFGPTLDPTLGRLLEETINIVQDVDQRLHHLKTTIAQAAPQLAPTLFWREMAAMQQTQRLPGLVSPVNPWGFQPGLAPSPLQLPSLTSPLLGAYGSTTPLVANFANPFRGY